jgi:Cu+-exporting ATPase
VLGSAKLIQNAPNRIGATFLARENGPVLAAFTFTDQLRPGVPAMLAKLRSSGITPLILTGDTEQAAQALNLGVPIIASASPEQKLATIQRLQSEGHVVAMLGDGVNDLAALTAADLPLSLISATDAAISAAALLLLRPEPMLAAEALSLARASYKVLWQGLAWALLYNLAAIPAAMLGALSPSLAAAAMAASSLSVLGNALRLRHWRQA